MKIKLMQFLRAYDTHG